MVSIALDQQRSYDILIGAGLLDRPESWQGLPKAACAVIVTNDKSPCWAGALGLKGRTCGLAHQQK